MTPRRLQHDPNVTQVWPRYDPGMSRADPTMTTLCPNLGGMGGLDGWLGAWLVVWLAGSLAGWRAGRLAVLLDDWFHDGPSETIKV